MKIGYIGEDYKKVLEDNFKKDSLIRLDKENLDLLDIDISFILSDIDITNLKVKYQKTMLVSFSKGANVFDNIQYIIQNKLNLGFMIDGDKITVLDPLGNLWYEGNDKREAIKISKERLLYLNSITRKSTFSINDKLPLNWYFNSFKMDEEKLDNEKEEVRNNELVKTLEGYSKIIYPYMGVDLSKVKNPKVRCAKTMPSFRKNGKIYVSRREINTTFLGNKDFVGAFLENDKIFYKGDFKPAVDSPIHLKVYEKYPQINYIIHTHVYIEDAPFSKVSNPCGAIEEFSEIENVIKEFYKDETLNQYKINLKGHGSIVLGKSLEDIQNIKYIKRDFPERMN